MNKLISLLFILLVLGSNVFGKQNNPLISEHIDWRDFLSRHDLIWEQTPDDYYNAPFLGNGLLGTMLYFP